VRGFVRGMAGLMSLCVGSYVFAQGKAAPARRGATTVSVPFVGCKSDGQLGPVDAPKGSRVPVQLEAKEAKELAYYSGVGLGVLGPRGWDCFGNIGSSGYSLLISPQPIDTTNVFSIGFVGPGIELSLTEGQSSGRLKVAEVIARVFPDYTGFVRRVSELFPGNSFPVGPYAKDKLTYRGRTVVEYQTPAQTDGLGMHSVLRRNSSPIEGVAILLGNSPDLFLLSVRLSDEQAGLTSAIIGQVEADADAAHFPH